MKKKENKKVTAKTAAKKTTVKKATSKKTTTAKTTGKAKAPATKKATVKTTSPKKRQTKVDKAEALRVQNDKDMRKLAGIPGRWAKKLAACKDAKERRKVDAEYQQKFEAAEKVEQASYKAYYDFVSENFTKEQQKQAMAKSKNFMSKKYTDSLRGGSNGK